MAARKKKQEVGTEMPEAAMVVDLHTFNEEAPGPGHNEGAEGEIPLFTEQEAKDAIAALKTLKADAKAETAAIRQRVQIAELRLLIPAMQQAYAYRNSNFLVKLIKGAGLSGPIKRAVLMTITNLDKVVDGKLVFDPARTPLTHRSAKTGALLPVWDESNWSFLKDVFHNEVKRGLSPISDAWKERFPAPDKTLAELQEAFASHIKGAAQKGLSLQDMLTMIQAKLAEGNLVE